MKKVYLHQPIDGCIESFIDFKRVRTSLESNGLVVTNSLKEADMVLVNSCVVGEIPHRNCLRDIAGLKTKMKKDAELVVTGCLPDYDPDSLLGYNTSFLFGPRRIDEFLLHFGLRKTEEYSGAIEPEYMGVYNIFNWVSRIILSANHFHIPIPEYLFRRFALIEDKNVIYLRISRGCKESCAYCATKFAAGNVLSNLPENILSNFDKYLRAGHRVFALCSEDAGSYGQDIGIDFIALLKEILKRKEQFIINIRQHSPNWVVKNLDAYLELLSDRRVKSITLPFQSGSDRILNLMGRRYNSAELSNMINAIHRHAPHLMLRTHVIVGFPTETDEDFEMTSTLVDELPWDMVLVFPYTDRPRTQAAKIKCKVPKIVIIKRSIKLAFKVLWKIYLNKGNFFHLVLKNPMLINNNQSP